jgi:hypothetical protein
MWRAKAAMKSDLEGQLVEAIAGFAHDPLGFVRFVYPWGEPGRELAAASGPRAWQCALLAELGRRLREGRQLGLLLPALMARASGHGVGKSTVAAWVLHWALSTMPDARVILTANTENQLRTKSWPEVAKWMRLAINSHWFRTTATAVYSADVEHERLWRADAIPWSEENTEAFAGLHNKGRRVVLLFDEASAISDKIWEVSEGALTDEDTEIVWLAFGNPTRNTGRFRECFGRFRHRWDHAHIDARDVEGTNKTQIESWLRDYGEDSDFFRVRVRGIFPHAGSLQFIASDLVEAAVSREVLLVRDEPLIMGVDVARFGDDASVIRFRRGRDARTIPPIKLRGADTMQLAARIADESARFRVDQIFIDGGGVGGGVVDRCRQIGLRVTEVQFGAKSDRAPVGQDRAIGYANKRAEIWASLRDWLAGGAIDSDPELIADLTGIEYGYVLRDGLDAIQLERKEDMKRRGLASPDDGDALALTFAYPVIASSVARSRRAGRFYKSDYSPYAIRPDEIISGDAPSPSAADRRDIIWHSDRLQRRAMGLPFEAGNDDDDW